MHLINSGLGVSFKSQANNNDDRFVADTPNESSITDSNRASGSVMDLVPPLTAELTNKKVYNSKTMVPVSEASMEPLAVVLVNHRSKRDDIGHRRTRRPFSVSEAEALVQAVEKPGTGRYMTIMRPPFVGFWCYCDLFLSSLCIE